MDFNWSSSLLLSSLILILPAFILLLFRSKSHKRLPPGPPGWPVFGHMFNLGTAPHITMANLKEKYGPVVWLRIGSINTMVVLTAKAATDFFKNHDLSFADRTIVETMRCHDYNKSSLVFAPYGPYWRMLRRICTMEMFVGKRINETVQLRRKCVDTMLSWIDKEANNETEQTKGIEVTRFVFLTSFNILGNLMLSRDLVDPESELASEFFTSMMRFVHWSSVPNVSDLFGFLKPLDLQGLQRNAKRDTGKLLEIASGFVKERMKERENGGSRRNDFLDVLLDFEGRGVDEPEKLSEHNICVFIMEIFVAGTETTSNSIEWALAELLKNPEKLIKAKDELRKVVGPNRKFEESDIDNVPYLQAILKESMRLHPPVPFLIPRQANKHTDFMGYNIPKGTQVYVNTWAIGRDPECWVDPLKFMPERFLGSGVDFRGQHFELIPFGAGRRLCPGLPLAHRVMHFVFGTLLHEYEWELAGSVTSETIDMSERIGVAARKFEPLIVVPRRAS